MGFLYTNFYIIITKNIIYTYILRRKLKTLFEYKIIIKMIMYNTHITHI